MEEFYFCILHCFLSLFFYDPEHVSFPSFMQFVLETTNCVFGIDMDQLMVNRISMKFFFCFNIMILNNQYNNYYYSEYIMYAILMTIWINGPRTEVSHFHLWLFYVCVAIQYTHTEKI